MFDSSIYGLGLTPEVINSLRDSVAKWLAKIELKKAHLRKSNPKDWVKVSEQVKLEFARLCGAEQFITHFFGLREESNW